MSTTPNPNDARISDNDSENRPAGKRQSDSEPETGKPKKPATRSTSKAAPTSVSPKNADKMAPATSVPKPPAAFQRTEPKATAIGSVAPAIPIVASVPKAAPALMPVAVPPTATLPTTVLAASPADAPPTPVDERAQDLVTKIVILHFMTEITDEQYIPTVDNVCVKLFPGNAFSYQDISSRNNKLYLYTADLQYFIRLERTFALPQAVDSWAKVATENANVPRNLTKVEFKDADDESADLNPTSNFAHPLLILNYVSNVSENAVRQSIRAYLEPRVEAYDDTAIRIFHGTQKNAAKVDAVDYIGYFGIGTDNPDHFKELDGAQISIPSTAGVINEDTLVPAARHLKGADFANCTFYRVRPGNVQLTVIHDWLAERMQGLNIAYVRRYMNRCGRCSPNVQLVAINVTEEARADLIALSKHKDNKFSFKVRDNVPNKNDNNDE